VSARAPGEGTCFAADRSHLWRCLFLSFVLRGVVHVASSTAPVCVSICAARGVPGRIVWHGARPGRHLRHARARALPARRGSGRAAPLRNGRGAVPDRAGIAQRAQYPLQLGQRALRAAALSRGVRSAVRPRDERAARVAPGAHRRAHAEPARAYRAAVRAQCARRIPASPRWRRAACARAWRARGRGSRHTRAPPACSTASAWCWRARSSSRPACASSSTWPRVRRQRLRPYRSRYRFPPSRPRCPSRPGTAQAPRARASAVHRGRHGRARDRGRSGRRSARHDAAAGGWRRAAPHGRFHSGGAVVVTCGRGVWAALLATGGARRRQHVEASDHVVDGAYGAARLRAGAAPRTVKHWLRDLPHETRAQFGEDRAIKGDWPELESARWCRRLGQAAACFALVALTRVLVASGGW
jgi:hypothetical protein